MPGVQPHILKVAQSTRMSVPRLVPPPLANGPIGVRWAAPEWGWGQGRALNVDGRGGKPAKTLTLESPAFLSPTATASNLLQPGRLE